MTTAHASLAEHAARLAAQADQVVLCLDFDGTLSPIVDDPEAARPLPGVVELLGPLAAWFAVAERQYGYGDMVHISAVGFEGATGTIEEVALRTTRLRTLNGEV